MCLTWVDGGLLWKRGGEEARSQFWTRCLGLMATARGWVVRLVLWVPQQLLKPFPRRRFVTVCTLGHSHLLAFSSCCPMTGSERWLFMGETRPNIYSYQIGRQRQTRKWSHPSPAWLTNEFSWLAMRNTSDIRTTTEFHSSVGGEFSMAASAQMLPTL